MVFCFNGPATTEIYTLSLHDALPILATDAVELVPSVPTMFKWFYDDADAVLADPNGEVIIADGRNHVELTEDRKSTRLNSSHELISYAVFCLKKKKEKTQQIQ